MTGFDGINRDPLQDPKVIERFYQGAQKADRQKKDREHEAAVRERWSKGQPVLGEGDMRPPAPPQFGWRDNPLTPGAPVPFQLPDLQSENDTRLFLKFVEQDFRQFVAEADAMHLQALATSGQMQEFQQQQMQELANGNLDDEVAMFQQGLPMLFSADRTAGGTQDPAGPISMQGPERGAYEDWAKSLYERMVTAGRHKDADQIGQAFDAFTKLADALGADEERIFQELGPRMDNPGDPLGDLLGGIADIAFTHDEYGASHPPMGIDISSPLFRDAGNEERIAAGLPPLSRTRPNTGYKGATRVGTLIRTAEIAFKDALDYRFFHRQVKDLPEHHRQGEGFTADTLGKGAGPIGDRDTYQYVLGQRIQSRLRDELKKRGLDTENKTEQFMRSMGSVLGLFTPRGATGTTLKAGASAATNLTKKLLGKSMEESFEGLGGKALEMAVGSAGAGGALMALGYHDGLTEDQLARLDRLEQSGSSVPREKVESEMRLRNGLRAAVLGPISIVSGGLGPLASRMPGIIGRAAGSLTKVAEQDTLKGFGARMFGEGVPFGIMEEAAAGSAELFSQLSASGDEDLQRAMELEFLAKPNLKNAAVQLLVDPSVESIQNYAEQVAPELAGLAVIEIVGMVARGRLGRAPSSPDQISALRRLVNGQFGTEWVDVGQMARAAAEAHEALDAAEGPPHQRAAARGLTDQVLADRDFQQRYSEQEDAPGDIREARLRVRAEMEELGDDLESEGLRDALEAEDNALRALENLDRWTASRWFDRAEEIRDWVAEGMEGEPPSGMIPLMSSKESLNRQVEDEAWLTSEEGGRFIEEGRYLKPAEGRTEFDEPIGPERPDDGPRLPVQTGRFQETFDADEIDYVLREFDSFRQLQEGEEKERIRREVGDAIFAEIEAQDPDSGFVERITEEGLEGLDRGEWGLEPQFIDRTPEGLEGLESGEWGLPPQRMLDAVRSQEDRAKRKAEERARFEESKAETARRNAARSSARKDREAGRERLNPDLRAEEHARRERRFSYGRGQPDAPIDDYERARAQRSQHEFNLRRFSSRDLPRSAVDSVVRSILERHGLSGDRPSLVFEDKPIRGKTVSTIDGDIDTARFGEPDSPQRAVEEAAEGRIPVEEVLKRPDLPPQDVAPRPLASSSRSTFKGLEPLNEKGTALDDDIARYNAGDTEAAAELIGHLGPTLRKAARAAVRGDKQFDVDEIEAEATVKVWQALSEGKLKAETARDLERQVMTTAKNLVTDMRRERKRRGELHGEMDAMSTEEGSTWQPADSSGRPEDQLAARETAVRELAMDPWALNNVTRAMPHLTAKEREVVGKIIEGKQNEQIADELGIKKGTVQSRRAAAKKKIERLMKKAGAGDLLLEAEMVGIDLREAEGAEVIHPTRRTGPMKPVPAADAIEHAADIASILQQEIGNRELSSQELESVFGMALERAGETEEPLGLAGRIEQLEQELSDAFDAGGAIGAQEFAHSLQPVLGGTVLGEILRYSPEGRAFIKRMEELAQIDSSYSGAPVKWTGFQTPQTARRAAGLWSRFGWWMRKGASDYTSNNVIASRPRSILPLSWRTPDTYAGRIHHLAMTSESKARAALATSMTQVYTRGESLFRPFKDDPASLEAIFDALEAGPGTKEWGDLDPAQAAVAKEIRDNMEAWRDVVTELHPQAQYYREMIRLMKSDLSTQEQEVTRANQRAKEIEAQEAADPELQKHIKALQDAEARYEKSFGKDKRSWPKDIQKRFKKLRENLKSYRAGMPNESSSTANRNAARAASRHKWIQERIGEVEGWLSDFQENWGLKNYILHRAAEGSVETWQDPIAIEYLNPKQLGTKRSGDYALTTERKRQVVRSRRLKKRGNKIEKLEKDVTKLWWEYVNQMTWWASVSEFTSQANEVLYGRVESIGDDLRHRDHGVLYRGGWYDKMTSPVRVQMKGGKPVEVGGKNGGRYVVLMRGERIPSMDQIKRNPSMLEDANITLVPVNEAKVSLREYQGGALRALREAMGGDQEAFDKIAHDLDAYAKTVGGEYQRRLTGFAARQRRVQEARSRRDKLLAANPTRNPAARAMDQALVAKAYLQNALEVGIEKYASISTLMALSSPTNWMNVLSGGMYANLLHGSIPGSRIADATEWAARRSKAFEGGDGTLPRPEIRDGKAELTDYHERLRTPEEEIAKLPPQEQEARRILDDAYVAASKYGIWPTSVVDDGFATSGSQGPWRTPWSGMMDFLKSGLGVGWFLKHAEGYARWEGFINDYVSARTTGEKSAAEAESIAMAVMHQKHVYYSRVTNPVGGLMGKNSPAAPLISGLNRYPIVKFMHAADVLIGKAKPGNVRAWKAVEISSAMAVAWLAWNLLGVDLNMMIGGSGEDLVDDLGGEGNVVGQAAGLIHDTVQDLLPGGDGLQPVPIGVQIPTAAPALKGPVDALHALLQAAVVGDTERAKEHLARVAGSIDPLRSSLARTYARAFLQEPREDGSGVYVPPRGLADRAMDLYPRVSYVLQHAGAPQLVYDLLPGQMSEVSAQFLESNRTYREGQRQQRADVSNSATARSRIRAGIAESNPLLIQEAGQVYMEHLIGKGTDPGMAASSWQRLVEDEMIASRMPAILRSIDRQTSRVQKWEALARTLENSNFQIPKEDLTLWMAMNMPDGDMTPRLGEAVQKAWALYEARYDEDR